MAQAELGTLARTEGRESSFDVAPGSETFLQLLYSKRLANAGRSATGRSREINISPTFKSNTPDSWSQWTRTRDSQFRYKFHMAIDALIRNSFPFLWRMATVIFDDSFGDN
jgi:hypothetical protein